MSIEMESFIFDRVRKQMKYAVVYFDFALHVEQILSLIQTRINCYEL